MPVAATVLWAVLAGGGGGLHHAAALVSFAWPMGLWPIYKSLSYPDLSEILI